jgi:hypothetical protein
MSASGLLCQITISARLPGAMTPTSPSRFMSHALALVLATIASIGVMPTSLTQGWRIIADAARGFRPLSKEPPRARMFVAG